MRHRFMPAATLALSLAAGPASAETGLVVQVLGGAVYNLELPLVIRQDGEEDIEIDRARYETRPFESPPYYVLRAGRWQDRRAWEVEFIHHKLYLENAPDEVQSFSISHGFNILTVNRTWTVLGLAVRLGAGPVITHPENTVRNRDLPEDEGLWGTGYYLSGAAVQGAAEKRFFVYRGAFVSAEAKLTGAWARVPVEDGEAELWNAALHGLLGVGWDF